MNSPKTVADLLKMEIPDPEKREFEDVSPGTHTAVIVGVVPLGYQVGKKIYDDYKGKTHNGYPVSFEVAIVFEVAEKLETGTFAGKNKAITLRFLRPTWQPKKSPNLKDIIETLHGKFDSFGDATALLTGKQCVLGITKDKYTNVSSVNKPMNGVPPVVPNGPFEVPKFLTKLIGESISAEEFSKPSKIAPPTPVSGGNSEVF